MNLFDLQGKVAIVTGGSSGIGLGIATGLGNAGATIAIASRDQSKAAEAVKQLKEGGISSSAFACDVANEADVRAMIKAVDDKYGRIDILVNNAGTNNRKRPEDMTYSEWRGVMDTNIDSAFIGSSAAYPYLKKSGNGKVINIGSMLSIFGSSWGPAYAASKGAVVQLTKSLAVAWAKDNIQVNCILPGWVDTPLTRKAREELPGLNEKVLQRLAAGRWATGDDFHGPAVFLCSAASQYVTGASLVVDGGFSVAVI